METHKTYDQMTEAERREIVEAAVDNLVAWPTNVADRLRAAVAKVELPPERFTVELRKPKRGEQYWNAGYWELAKCDKSFKAMVRLSKTVKGADLTDADLGRKVSVAYVTPAGLVHEGWLVTGRAASKGNISRFNLNTINPYGDGWYYVENDATVTFLDMDQK